MNGTRFVFNLACKPKDGVGVPPRPQSIVLIEDTIGEPKDAQPTAWYAQADAQASAQDAEKAPKYRPTGLRNDAQQNGIKRIKIESITPIYKDETAEALAQMFAITPDTFDTLDWAYRCYKIEKPPERKFVYDGGKPLFQSHIYLFNVLVAFEWWPSEQNVTMLERAAQRAADFLFDVTNGWMTFGQVLLGGPDLMDCADIQVLASNRILPRSWVGGLHEPHKYMPIRLGRGLWQKNSRGSIPWDEPEGYRTMVHEWAHYALELLDDYVDTHLVYIRDDTRPIQSEHEARRSNRELIVPSISQPVESIMSTLEGTSELTAKRSNDPRKRKESEWDAIIDGFLGLDGQRKPRFPRILKTEKIENGQKEILYPANIEGPLPLRELPHIAWVQTEGKPWRQELLLPAVPPALRAEHCWVYILKKPDAKRIPTHIIAQGTLDAQIEDGFRLFGAEAGDDIVLIGNDPSWCEHVLRAKIAIDTAAPGRTDGRQAIKIEKWEDCTPEEFPIIDIVPESVSATANKLAGRTAPVHVDVKLSDYPKQEISIYLYPTDYVNSNGRGELHYIKLTPGESTIVPVALDGHVLLKLRDEKGLEKLVIATCSQGGGPSTGSPVGGTPMTPGSSEGNLMVFFADRGEYPKRNQHHSCIRVVTTRLPGGAGSKVVPRLLPGGAENKDLVSDTEPRSYAYTLCSNDAIPAEYAPTLSLFYDKRTELQDGEAFIHRLNSDGIWILITSYRPEGAWYVAAALDQTTAPNLMDPNLADGKPRVERYRLFFIPSKRQY